MGPALTLWARKAKKFRFLERKIEPSDGHIRRQGLSE